MLNPLAQAFAWYGVGGYAIALLCAIPYFDRPPTLDGAWPDRLLRRATLLALAGVLHPVIALTAVGITRDVDRLADDRPAAWARTSLLASASLLLSLGIAVVVFVRPPGG
ncbi:MAG: hypothetical protein JWN67_1319 [Actinomycetia bacterium]|nr:hypothetical protein [Actinomycetes bacterium]